jgi:hypothetical protein
MTTRRELLVLGSMAGVGMMVPDAVEANVRNGAAPETAADELSPTREQLLAQVNTSFVVRREDGDLVTLVLVAVADPALSGHRRQPGSFRAVFRGPRGASLGQDTYAVANAALGEFPLFLVPVGRTDRTGPLYEAAFNRL